MTNPKASQARSNPWRLVAAILGSLLTLSVATVIVLSTRGLPCVLQ